MAKSDYRQTHIFLDGLFKNPFIKIAMSMWAGVGSGGRHWASSEIYLLVNYFKKPVHNAVRHFFCYDMD